jgi:hypothetical protein
MDAIGTFFFFPDQKGNSNTRVAAEQLDKRGTRDYDSFLIGA